VAQGACEAKMLDCQLSDRQATGLPLLQRCCTCWAGWVGQEPSKPNFKSCWRLWSDHDDRGLLSLGGTIFRSSSLPQSLGVPNAGCQVIITYRTGRIPNWQDSELAGYTVGPTVYYSRAYCSTRN